MHLTTYLGLADTGEQTLADSFRQVSSGHGDEPDVRELTERFADQCDEHRRLLAPLTERYGEHAEEEPERLHAEGLPGTRSGGVGLLRDLHDLYLLASYLDIAWTMVGQAARAVRDQELVDVVSTCEQDVQGQLAWLRTRMKAAAPQALVVG
ncbi:hypothetical protein [Phycicoccus duodecadis]|uniref:Ferritin-like metal-binding protein YciE n=1 Tax=Phycicoccus duodecadis TaxID=173053 RepID=A0A2N3YHB6_9MICO|nr:hypothetical protein [Phycicoccus duodecadis]PKW26221.1 hypothetical protein ATL31_1027 [Phycicoccus duodecadis]